MNIIGYGRIALRNSVKHLDKSESDDDSVVPQVNVVQVGVVKVLGTPLATNTYIKGHFIESGESLSSYGLTKTGLSVVILTVCMIILCTM